MNLPVDYTASQMQTIRRTVAADCNDGEFNLFMEAARSFGLDPFRRQISAIVFNKDKPERRRMAIIVGRDGLRSIASRTGDYRPASGPAEFEVSGDAKGEVNPLGIIRCAVTLHKQDRAGEWHPVYGEAYWDEFAPITEKWEYNQAQGRRAPTGEMEIQKGNWTKMPRLMIQKCAEAQALRAGWPDQFGGLYAEEEMDQAVAREMRDVTPSDAVNAQEIHDRKNLLGAHAIMFADVATGKLERWPLGVVADRCAEIIDRMTPEAAYRWRETNTEPLREFWAQSPSDALAIKVMLESKVKPFEEQMKSSGIAAQ